MSTARTARVYEEHVKGLSADERIQLIGLIAADLAPATSVANSRRRSILELHGLGREIWGGIDAQEYVNQLRSEWDERSP